MNRLVKYLAVVLKWRKFVFSGTGAVTVLAIVVSLVLPYRYRATARVLPPPEEDLYGFTSMLGGRVGGSQLSRIAAAGFMGRNTPSELMAEIAQGRSVSERVVARCSIIDYYRVRRRSVERALRVLGRLATFDVSDEGIVSISVQAKRPALAAKIANTFVVELDSFLRTSNMSRGRNMRVFVAARLVQLDSSLQSARKSLQEFQEANRTVTIDDELRASVEAYARLKSELMAKEVEFGIVRAFAGDDNPLYSRLEREVNAFRGTLGEMETGSGTGGFGAGFGIAYTSLPRVSREFMVHYRNVRVQEEAYAMLYQQLEYARILEARDAPTVAVLDVAVPPERRSSPKRLVIVVAAFVFGLLGSVSSVFVAHYFQELRTARPQEYAVWVETVSVIRHGLGRVSGHRLTRKRH